MADDHGHGSGGHERPNTHAEHGSREPFIFALVLGTIILIPLTLVFVLELPPIVAVLAMLVLLGVLALAPRIVTIHEYERGVVFLFGKFQYVAQPGWHVVFPAVQSIERVDMRTQVLDIEPQEVITKEDIHLTIDAVAYIRITDAKKVVIEVKDVKHAVTKLLHGELRVHIGNIAMQDVIENMDAINEKLFKALKRVEDEWGIKATNVEMTEVVMPKGIETAFREKLEANEKKQKLEIDAAARKQVLTIVDEATRNMDDKTMAYLYMQTLKHVADGRSTKIVLPMELTDLARKLAKTARGDNLEKLAKKYLGKN
ncbi:MAG: stomatin-like protein [Candidatus Micrarchaeota archaeon]|nr:stomatin-like protein [Candidatus Micrarchaeota archaeon]